MGCKRVARPFLRISCVHFTFLGGLCATIFLEFKVPLFLSCADQYTFCGKNLVEGASMNCSEDHFSLLWRWQEIAKVWLLSEYRLAVYTWLTVSMLRRRNVCYASLCFFITRSSLLSPFDCCRQSGCCCEHSEKRVLQRSSLFALGLTKFEMELGWTTMMLYRFHGGDHINVCLLDCGPWHPIHSIVALPGHKQFLY